MKVKDLIEKLMTITPEAKAVIHGRECCDAEVRSVDEMEIELDLKKEKDQWYFGEYRESKGNGAPAVEIR